MPQYLLIRLILDTHIPNCPIPCRTPQLSNTLLQELSDLNSGVPYGSLPKRLQSSTSRKAPMHWEGALSVRLYADRPVSHTNSFEP